MSTILTVVVCALFLVLGVCIGMVVGISELRRKEAEKEAWEDFGQ